MIEERLKQIPIFEEAAGGYKGQEEDMIFQAPVPPSPT
jgi:hypothetical protein